MTDDLIQTRFKIINRCTVLFALTILWYLNFFIYLFLLISTVVLHNMSLPPTHITLRHWNLFNKF